jgi:hypothetical protein
LRLQSDTRAGSPHCPPGRGVPSTHRNRRLLPARFVVTLNDVTERPREMPQRLTMIRAAAAGLAGTGAVVGAMACARRMGLTRLDFPRIIATALGRERSVTRAAGWALFVWNGAALALGYRTALRFTGREASVPRGAVVGLAHGLVAAGAAALLSPVHPRPDRAGLVSETGPRPPLQDLAVHVVYGAVIGAFARGRA